MTSIAAWVGVDSRGPASLNIVSDSRISWSGTRNRWDQGRKVFAAANSGHLFGYCGDVLFPALALPVIVDRIDRGLLVDHQAGQQADVEQALRRLAVDYPEQRDFTILHAFRMGEGMSCQFKLVIITYKSGVWTTTLPPMPRSSAFMHIDGSGRKSIEGFDQLWQESSSGNTSRAVYSAFCEAIKSGQDSYSGGPPQVGSIYRSKPAQLIGVVVDGERYFAGSKLIGTENPANIEWRNELFERYDGLKKRRLAGAQRHSPR